MRHGMDLIASCRGERMGVKRGHHFLSRCYLKGFGQRQGEAVLMVGFELATGRTFPASTRDVGKVTDFNRIDLPNIGRNDLEDAIAKFEDVLGPVLMRIIENGGFENEDQLVIVLNFMAHLLARNPRRRRRHDQYINERGSIMLRADTSSPEQFERMMAKARVDGVFGDDEPTYEEMRDLAYDHEAKIGLDQNWMIDFELNHFRPMLDLLAQRKWMLCRAADDAGIFITSDHPVCGIWHDARKAHQLVQPDIAMENTVVIFPVSSKLAMIGTWDEAALPPPISDRHRTSVTNQVVLGCADKQVYAQSTDFYYRSLFTGQITRGDQLEAELKRAAALRAASEGTGPAS